MMKKIFYSLFAIALIAFLAFCIACFVGWTKFTVWGMVISAIATFVFTCICIWLWLGDYDFNDHSVHCRGLLE
ncbi:MAG: hypothetical protein IJ582_05915 [Prevotella sp.]|nr:hypothetical protein [Prevotella sp.]